VEQNVGIENIIFHGREKRQGRLPPHARRSVTGSNDSIKIELPGNPAKSFFARRRSVNVKRHIKPSQAHLDIVLARADPNAMMFPLSSTKSGGEGRGEEAG
jgi:hypothetical protein